jgi:hypothetical protein
MYQWHSQNCSTNLRNYFQVAYKDDTTGAAGFKPYVKENYVYFDSSGMITIKTEYKLVNAVGGKYNYSEYVPDLDGYRILGYKIDAAPANANNLTDRGKKLVEFLNVNPFRIVYFVYEPIPAADITASKKVTGDPAPDTDVDFEFILSITKEGGASAAGETINISDGSSIVLNSNGEGAFTLKDGQSITFKAIPVGWQISVTEAEEDYYTPSIDVSGDSLGAQILPGACSTGLMTITTKDAGEIAFTNDYSKPAAAPSFVTVSKVVTGEYADKNKPFDFTIMLWDTVANAYVEEVSYTDNNTGVSGSLTLDSNGEGSFELMHGQSITFGNLSADWIINIKEKETQSYKPSCSITPQGITLPENENTLTYGDPLETGDLMINPGMCTIEFSNERDELIVTGLENMSESNKIFMITAGSLLALGAALLAVKRRNKGTTVKYYTRGSAR